MNRSWKKQMQYPPHDCNSATATERYCDSFGNLHNSYFSHICLMRAAEPRHGRKWIRQSKLKTMVSRSLSVESRDSMDCLCGARLCPREISAKNNSGCVHSGLIESPQKRSWEPEWVRLNQNTKTISLFLFSSAFLGISEIGTKTDFSRCRM